MTISKNVTKWIRRASDEAGSYDPERMMYWLAGQCVGLQFDHRTAMLLLDFAKTEIDELSKRLAKGEIMAQK